MKFYVSTTIGDGTDDNAFRPSVSQHLSTWRCVDMRVDATASGQLFVECDPTEQEHLNIINDPLNTFINTDGLLLNDKLSNHSDLNTLLTTLEGYQIPTDDFDGNNTLRELLQRITKRFLIRQLLAGADMPNDLEAYLTESEQLAAQSRANQLGVSPDLTQRSRDIIKEVAAINHKYLKTNYDS